MGKRLLRVSREVMAQFIKGGLSSCRVHGCPEDLVVEDADWDIAYDSPVFQVASKEFSEIGEGCKIPYWEGPTFRKANPWQGTVNKLVTAEMAGGFISFGETLAESEFNKAFDAQLMEKMRRVENERFGLPEELIGEPDECKIVERAKG